MKELSFWGILQISLVMPVLLFLSVVMVGVFIERALFFARMAHIDPILFKNIKEYLVGEN